VKEGEQRFAISLGQCDEAALHLACLAVVEDDRLP
jgi:hypothetical protein